MMQTAADPTMSIAWGAPVVTAVCERCDWSFLVPAGSADEALKTCPRCFQGPLSKTEEPDATPSGTPELAAPFSLDAAALDRAIQHFAGGIPYPPEDLTAAKLRGRLRQMYLPVWLVDAGVRAEWQAETGYEYDVVSHQDRFEGGGWSSQEVKERRIRWEPRLGRLDRSYQNVEAPALEAHGQIKASLGDFDRRAARPFTPEVVSAAAVRRPDRQPQDAWVEARAALQASAAEECRQAAGADHIRQFTWRPEFSEQNWTLLLLPVFTAFYRDDEGRSQPVWINGQTGRVDGTRRASQRRATRSALILLGVAALIFVIGLALAAASTLFPPLLVFAILGLTAGLVLGLGAIIPVLRAWWFNRGAEAHSGAGQHRSAE